MKEKDIEEFITYLDQKYKDYCLNPDNMNIDCCDCYPCRKDFFNKVREELKNYEYRTENME